MADSEEEKVIGVPKQDGGAETLSAHNNPPNQPNEGQEVETGDTAKPQKED